MSLGFVGLDPSLVCDMRSSPISALARIDRFNLEHRMLVRSMLFKGALYCAEFASHQALSLSYSSHTRDKPSRGAEVSTCVNGPARSIHRGRQNPENHVCGSPAFLENIRAKR